MKKKIEDFDQKHPVLTFFGLMVICIVLIAAMLISESVVLLIVIVVLSCSDLITAIAQLFWKNHKEKNG